jgi:hypothetical protein
MHYPKLPIYSKRQAICAPESLWRRPTACNIHPLGKATAFFSLDINNIGIAPAPASDAVLLFLVPIFPVIVLLFPLLLVERRFL